MSKREFQTEVSQLLQLIIHSLYSHPEIFLRELVSNSSDALDKLRHLTLTDDAFKALPFNPRIDLELDEENKTLTIADTGIGMNEEDLVAQPWHNRAFRHEELPLAALRRREERLKPYRQFGVGFYSVFMVADRVEVVSRKAGEEQAWRWTSDGKSGFDIEPAGALRRRNHRSHSLQRGKGISTPIAGVCRRSSKNTPTTLHSPIFLTYDKTEWNEDEKKSIKVRTTEQVQCCQRSLASLKERAQR